MFLRGPAEGHARRRYVAGCAPCDWSPTCPLTPMLLLRRPVQSRRVGPADQHVQRQQPAGIADHGRRDVRQRPPGREPEGLEQGTVHVHGRCCGRAPHLLLGQSPEQLRLVLEPSQRRPAAPRPGHRRDHSAREQGQGEARRHRAARQGSERTAAGHPQGADVPEGSLPSFHPSGRGC